MLAPSIPDCEAERLEALMRLDLLDTAPEPEFDRITRLAQTMFGVQTAVVSLVESDRQWFKSCVGLDATETSREVSFCGHTILKPDVMVVEDALRDVRFADNPLVTGAPHIRFYAGAPLITEQGYRIGSLCLIDPTPRAFSETERAELADLAAMVMDAIHLRSLIRDNEAQYRDRLSLLAAAIDGSEDGISLIEADGSIGYANPAQHRQLGLDPDSLTGQSADAVAGGSLEAGKRLIQKSACPTPHRELRINALPDGRRIAVSRDIGDRIAAEAERARLNARLHQAEKLEAIGRLAGGIAHDFNNVLTAMLGYGDLLCDDLDLQDPRRDLADQIVSSGMRAKELVEQILVFSRTGGAAQGISTEARAVVADAARIAANGRGCGALAVDLPATPLWVAADPARLSQIVLNLAANACDAMEGRCGDVTVSLSLADKAIGPDGALAWAGTEPDGSHLRLRVADSGPGIDPEVATRLFEPFFTTKPAGRGTGLGLAAVHGIVLALDGAIAIRARGEKDGTSGTIVDVMLPLSAAPEQAAEPDPGSGTARKGAARVLLVDDDALARRAMALGIARSGFSVVEAETGSDALNQIDKGEAIAIAIIDQSMPGLSGLQTIAKLRAQGWTAPVLLHSGYLSEADEDEARRLEVHAILRKPVLPKAMTAGLSDALGLARHAQSRSAA